MLLAEWRGSDLSRPTASKFLGPEKVERIEKAVRGCDGVIQSESACDVELIVEVVVTYIHIWIRGGTSKVEIAK
jgi:hypothetical protein